MTATVEQVEEEESEPQGLAKIALRTFMANKLAVGSLLILVLVVLFCYLGPVFYHTNQVVTNLLLENQAPSGAHILGTSPTGKDELGRLMLGGQSTIELGFAVGVLSTGFGLIWGTVAGFAGGVSEHSSTRDS